MILKETNRLKNQCSTESRIYALLIVHVACHTWCGGKEPPQAQRLRAKYGVPCMKRDTPEHPFISLVAQWYRVLTHGLPISMDIMEIHGCDTFS